MATTAQQVFDLAIGLMGEVDSAGLTDTSANAEYKNRTLLILNALRGELFPYSDNYAVTTGGTRPVMTYISDFTTAIGLDDVIAQTVLPYGLAAQLTINDDPNLASFFQQRYEELIRKLQNTPSEWESIEDMYGGIDNFGL
jgi:hypothetical protein